MFPGSPLTGSTVHVLLASGHDFHNPRLWPFQSDLSPIRWGNPFEVRGMVFFVKRGFRGTWHLLRRLVEVTQRMTSHVKLDVSATISYVDLGFSEGFTMISTASLDPTA